MITKNHNPYINKTHFKHIIKEMLFEGQNPVLEQSGTEINLYYNHPVLPKRLCHRMGMFRTQHFCAQYLEELADIMETVRKEWGL